MKPSKSEVASKEGTRIGVLSDSHGDAMRTRRAVEELTRLGATMFIHCGDIETIECLDPLAGLDAHIVFGNCDEPSDLQDYARSIDITVHHPLGEIIIDDQRIAFTHGDDPKSMQRPIDTKAQWLFHGHTHLKRDVKIGSTRVVNPGALHRAKPHTVALVIPRSGLVEFQTIL